MTGARIVSHNSLRIGLLIALFSSQSAAFCSEGVRFSVGDIKFCAPRSAIVDVDILWIPPELPGDGFVFQLTKNQIPVLVQQRDIRGKKMNLIGSVSAGNWKPSDQARDSYARERATAQGSLIEGKMIGGLIFIYESALRRHWTVWQLPHGLDVDAETLERFGMQVAVCSTPAGVYKINNWKGSQATCRRNIYFDKIMISYSMDVENLRRYEQLDKEIKQVVMSWRCPEEQ